MSFFGYIRLRTYASLIKDTADGKAIATITRGLLCIAIYLPVSAIVSVITNYVIYLNRSLGPIATIINNYIVLGLILAGFYTLLRGSSSLIKLVKQHPYAYKEKLIVILFIIASGLYAYSTLRNPSRQFPTQLGGKAAFYLPDLLLVTTIIIPYILFLYCGIRTAYNIHIYRSNVAGIIYREALDMLAYGIALVTTCIMITRFLNSAPSLLNTTAKLRVILGFAYLLLILVAVGFGLIAAGAKKLQKIEEV